MPVLLNIERDLSGFRSFSVQALSIIRQEKIDMKLTVKTGQPVMHRIKGFFKCDARSLLEKGFLALVVVTALFLFVTFCRPVGGLELPDDRGSVMEFVRAEINFICTGCSGKTVQNAINTKFDSGAISGQISNLLKTFATTICVMLWLCSLLTSYINQQAYAELIVKKIMILALSLALIAKAPDLCQTIMDVGTQLADKAIEVTNDTSTDSTEQIMQVLYKAQDDAYIESYNESIGEDARVGETEKSDSIWSISLDDFLNYFKEKIAAFRASLSFKAGVPLTFALVFFIPMVCTAVAYVIIIITCYSRGVEMAILKVLSPIPMGLVVNEPLGSGAGAKFLKNVAAVALQGVILIIIPAVMGGVISTTLTTAVSNLQSVNGHFGDMMKTGLEMGAIAVAEAMIMSRSLSFAQKALGLQ